MLFTEGLKAVLIIMRQTLRLSPIRDPSGEAFVTIVPSGRQHNSRNGTGRDLFSAGLKIPAESIADMRRSTHLVFDVIVRYMLLCCFI